MFIDNLPLPEHDTMVKAPEALPYVFVHYYYIESGQGTSCEHCGHPIKQVYVVRQGNRFLNVGCDCVYALGAISEDTPLDKAQKFAKRATREWSQKPELRRAGEVKSDFVNRRVNEMFNCRKANLALHQWQNKNPWQYPWCGTYGKGYRAYLAWRNQTIEAIEVQYKANRHDFERDTFSIRKLY